MTAPERDKVTYTAMPDDYANVSLNMGKILFRIRDTFT
jgi:hypothetical protein